MARIWRLLGLALLAGTARADGTLSIGADAPPLTLKDVAGQAHVLADLKDQSAVMLVWMSIKCPASAAYERRIQSLYEEFKARHVTLWVIDSGVGEEPEAIRAHQAEHQLTYPVLRDPNGKACVAYGASVTPEVFMLDGGLKLKYHGAVDNNRDPARVDPAKRFARNALLALLDGRDPDPATTVASGCSIEHG
jgi:peroxiredoxin